MVRHLRRPRQRSENEPPVMEASAQEQALYISRRLILTLQFRSSEKWTVSLMPLTDADLCNPDKALWTSGKCKLANQ